MATHSIENLSPAERLAVIESELRKHVAELFPPVMEQWKAQPVKRNMPATFAAPKDECMRRMVEHVGESALREGAAEIYFAHGPWYGHDLEGWYGQVIMTASRPSPDVVMRIGQRLEHLCRTAYENIHLPKYCASFHEESGSFSCNSMGQGEPSRATCTALLLSVAGRQDALAVLRKIADGSFNHGPFDVVLPIYRQGKKVEERSVPLRSYQRFQQDMFPSQMTDIVLSFAEAGQLTQELLGAAARNLPETLRWLGPQELALQQAGSEKAKAMVADMANQFGKEVSANFDTEWTLLPQMAGGRGCWLRGPWALLEAARHHQRLKLGKLKTSGWSYFFDFFDAKKRSPELAVIQLAKASDTEPGDPGERKMIVAELKKFPRKTLEALLPVAMRSPRILLEALGWETAYPLVDRLYSDAQLAGHHDFYSGKTPYADATGNSPDPGNGVVDVSTVQRLIEAAGREVAGKILTSQAECNGAVANTAMLFAAVGGYNAADVEKKLARRNQTAVKAFGLLPLTRGNAEALERYQAIKLFDEESAEFGPERKANEHAAAHAALANLAQAAGYTNVLRLEWAMEAQQGAQEDPFGRSWKVGEHRAELVLEGNEPKLRFYSKDKLLKAAAAALKASDRYEEMKELLASTKKQYKRMRTTFERMMSSSEWLSGADLKMLGQLPIANRLLARVVLGTEAEAKSPRFFGTWNDGTLAGPGGKTYKTGASDKFVIAHTYDLFEQGQLGAWQAEFVRREWVQPFRQVFRELYLPLASERDKEECERFASQSIKTAVATRLLAARGWEFRNTGRVEVYFFDRERQLVAEWLFPGAGGHYFSEQPSTASGAIRFAKGVSQGERTQIERRLKLAEVPPVFLSEILRDADLVCSVAAVEVKEQVSREVQERRADAVRAVLAPLQLENVNFEEEFVRVKGKLADYKVSCWNPSFVREPGQTAFVFPAGTRLKDEKLFLPFADEDDELLSAVCTAVLVLAQDDQIKDKSLLEALQVSKE